MDLGPALGLLGMVFTFASFLMIGMMPLRLLAERLLKDVQRQQVRPLAA